MPFRSREETLQSFYVFILHQEKAPVYELMKFILSNYLTKPAFLMYVFKSKGNDEDSNCFLNI